MWPLLDLDNVSIYSLYGGLVLSAIKAYGVACLDSHVKVLG